MATKTDALLAGDASITEIDELRPLIAEGQERGFLTFEQIATALEEVEVSKEQVTELHAYLEGEGIEIVSCGRAMPGHELSIQDEIDVMTICYKLKCKTVLATAATQK